MRDMPDEAGARPALDVRVNWGAGLHTPVAQGVDGSAYEKYIGRWSRLFVPALLAAADVGQGDHVLDVATGTGEAALPLLAVVGQHGLVVGADISEGMLEVAAARVRSERFSPVVTDAQSLPFPPNRFDAIVCQLGLMFFPNPQRGLAEIRRTLRQGRRSAVSVLSSPDKAPMWGIFADTLSQFLPHETQVLHLSFSLSDHSQLERLFVAAGFREVRVTKETRAGTFWSFDEYWAPIEAGIGTLPQAYLALPPSSRLDVRSEVHDRLSKFESDGHYEMTLEVLIGSGAN